MNILKRKSLSLWLVIGILGILGIGGLTYAYAGSGATTVIENCSNCTFGSLSGSEDLGSVSDARPARLLTVSYLQALNDVDIDGDLNVDGALTATGAIAGKSSLSTVSTYVASTTLATTDSGKTFILTTTTEFVLPATSTSAGVHYKFVVGGSLTASSTI